MAEKSYVPFLLQLHWQSRANPDETEFVAQGEFMSANDVQPWVTEIIERRRAEIPDGFVPMICTQDCPLFVVAKA